ncbi:MAG TPA: phosphate signaling complex protein PhoU [Patescibacteria group bacterium]|nr:phosphate signaling complex protein PhoU [Patescibacteria group bacterium]
MTVRHSYDQELAQLQQSLLEMGQVVAEAIDSAVSALSHQDVVLAREVLEGDDVVDQLQIDIEDRCMVLIARQQPMARDLRIIGTGLKITTDLERIGDHAYDIAKITLELADQPLIKPLVDIPRMAQMAQKMLRGSLDAYIRQDLALAEQICLDDDEVDNIYHQVFRELLTYMMEDPRNIGQATQLLFVARYLERIADHTTNIAEWTIYMVTGQRRRKK